MRNICKLRTIITIDNMQPQYAAIAGTVSQGSVPLAGMSGLYVELAPGSIVYRLLDAALKQTDTKPSFQSVEREYGEFELHSSSFESIVQASEIILGELGLTIADRKKPKIVSEQIISKVDPHQAQLVNRSDRYGSLLIPGDTLFVMEVEPAAYISLAVNEAEKNANISVITFDPVGQYGRMLISGKESEIRQARDAAVSAIQSIEGNDE